MTRPIWHINHWLSIFPLLLGVVISCLIRLVYWLSPSQAVMSNESVDATKAIDASVQPEPGIIVRPIGRVIPLYQHQS